MGATMTTTPGAERLKQMRDASGLSQQKLAEIIGKHVSTITKLEAGDVEASRRTAEAIDEALKANGQILAAFGFTQPTDVDAALEEIRDQMRAMNETLLEHSALLAALRAGSAQSDSGQPPSTGEPR